MTSQREAAWQAYSAHVGWDGSHVRAFYAGWDARDADVSALLEYAARQIEARDALLVSYRVGRLTKKAERTIDAIEPEAPVKVRAALAAFPTEEAKG